MKERHITKKQLISLSEISENDYRKMKDNKDVSLLCLRKICLAFDIELNKVLVFNFVLF